MIQKIIVFTLCTPFMMRAMNITDEQRAHMVEKLQRKVQQRTRLAQQLEQACRTLNNSEITLATLEAQTPEIDTLNKQVKQLSSSIHNLLIDCVDPRITHKRNLNQQQLLQCLNQASTWDKQVFETIAEGDKQAGPSIIATEALCKQIYQKALVAAQTESTE